MDITKTNRLLKVLYMLLAIVACYHLFIYCAKSDIINIELNYLYKVYHIVHNLTVVILLHYCAYSTGTINKGRIRRLFNLLSIYFYIIIIINVIYLFTTLPIQKDLWSFILTFVIITVYLIAKKT